MVNIDSIRKLKSWDEVCFRVHIQRWNFNRLSRKKLLEFFSLIENRILLFDQSGLIDIQLDDPVQVLRSRNLIYEGVIELCVDRAWRVVIEVYIARASYTY